MYDWRKLTEKERKTLLKERIQKGFPHHRPPHFYNLSGYYHIAAACYEHAHFIGTSPQRILDFSHALLEALDKMRVTVHAWCVLPNHYHLLVVIEDLKSFMINLGKLHGRTSHTWNGEENSRGRKVWHNAGDRYIRSEGHFWATMNYIHHNPVHHGYVRKWLDWPYTSAHEFMKDVGPDKAAEIWRKYPVRDYGKGWDDPDV